MNYVLLSGKESGADACLKDEHFIPAQVNKVRTHIHAIYGY